MVSPELDEGSNHETAQDKLSPQYTMGDGLAILWQRLRLPI